MLPLLQNLLKSTTSSCTSRRSRKRRHAKRGNMQAQILEDRMLLAGIFTSTDIVVKSGDAAPDVSGNNGTFDEFSKTGSIINDAGQVLYYSTDITGSSNQSFTGLFKTTSSGTSLIARTKQDIPQIAGATFSSPGEGNGSSGQRILPFNESGQAVFVNQNAQGVSETSGYFVGSGTVNSLEMIAKEGGNAPASSGSSAKFGSSDGDIEAAINNFGQIAFRQGLTGTDNGTLDKVGIFRGDASGNVVEIVQKGQTIPGTSGGTFTSFSFPSINDAGHVAFIGFNNNTDQLDGIYVGDGTSLRTVAQEGSTLNGNADGDQFALNTINNGVSINKNGDVAFSSGVLDSSGSSLGRSVFVRQGNEVLRRFTMTESGTIGRSIALNDNGDVAYFFNPSIGSPKLYRGDANGSVKLIAEVGQTVSGGDKITQIVEFSLNNSGQMAFVVYLDTDGAKALFFYDDVLGLTEIVRQGDVINGLSVFDFNFAGNTVTGTPYRPSNRDGLNNKGQVTFSYELDNSQFGPEGVAVVSVNDRTIQPSSITGFEDGNWWVSTQDSGTWQTSFWGQFPVTTLTASVSGDFNGDGVDDVAGRAAGGIWHLGIAQADGTLSVSTWNGWQGKDISEVYTGDFNGDGKADLLGRDSNGKWWAAESQGNTFTTRTWAKWKATGNWNDIQIGDFNNDGKDDIVGRRDDGRWWVALSNGTQFQTTNWGRWKSTSGWQDVSVGDFNGDGLADITGRTSSGRWWTLISQGNAFASSFWGKWSSSGSWSDVVVGDFNADGNDDIAGRRSSGTWWAALSQGNAFTTSFLGQWKSTGSWNDVVVGDFNEDGKDDIGGRRSNGTWWNALSNGNNHPTQKGAQWGSALNWSAVFVGRYIGPAVPVSPPVAASAPAFGDGGQGSSSFDAGGPALVYEAGDSSDNQSNQNGSSDSEQSDSSTNSPSASAESSVEETFGDQSLLDLLYQV